MPISRVTLEGTWRLARVNRIKRMFFLLQLIMMVILSIFLLNYSGMSFSPFYMPVGAFIYFVAIMVIVISIENFFFRILAIKYSKTDGTKFIIAKNSINRALMISVVCIIVAVILLLPPVINSIEDGITKRGTLVEGEPVYFGSEDFLGLSRPTGITLTMDRGNADVILTKKENYDPDYDEEMLRGSAVTTVEVSSGREARITLYPTYDYKEYALLVFYDTNTTGGAVNFVIDRQIFHAFKLWIPVLAVMYLIANCIWIVYLLPIRKKYEASSIYK